MKAILRDGPYDGTSLDHNDINLYTRFLPVGIRQFVLMPPRADWDSVRRGELEKDGPFNGSDRSFYELLRDPNGIEGRYDSDGSAFAAAQKENREGLQPAIQVAFTGQYFKCYRGDLRDVTLPPNHFSMTDEKGRNWACMAVSREEGESGGFGEMLSYFGGEPLSKPLQVVTLHCEDESELLNRLADQID